VIADLSSQELLRLIGLLVVVAGSSIVASVLGRLVNSS
jgi:uncharacterized protein YjeT (DUF2065 family)